MRVWVFKVTYIACTAAYDYEALPAVAGPAVRSLALPAPRLPRRASAALHGQDASQKPQ